MNVLFYNAVVRTQDEQNTTAEAVGVTDGIITFVGATAEARQFSYEQEIDLGGRLMLPGFSDSHLHVVNYSFVENSVRLFGCTCVEEALARAAARIQEKGKENVKWLYCRGWKEEEFSVKRYPTRAELDQIADDIPIIFVRICGHVAVVNRFGLERLSRLPSFDSIRQDVDFETGLIKENAVQFFYEVLDRPAMDEVQEIMRFGMKRLNESGITSVQSDDFTSLPGKDWELNLKSWKNLSEKNEMTVRVYQQCLFEEPKEYKKFLQKGYRTGQGSYFYKLGPLKLLSDGCLGARTAALEEPYEGTQENGIAVWSREGLNEMVRLAYESDMQIAVHCIGDRAMGMVLDAYEEAEQITGKKGRRNGIVHAQLTNQTLLERIKKDGVITYIQPIFADMDMDIVESRIGARRMDKVYAWKSMMDMGILATGGSDAPCAGFNIMENIYCAVTRKNLKGEPKGGWLPDEKLSVDEAVKLFTKYPPFAEFNETVKGTIETGKLADMAVLSEDIYEIDPDRIKDVKVVRTIVGGKTVYKA